MNVKVKNSYILNIKKKSDYRQALKASANREATVNKVLTKEDAIHTLNNIYASVSSYSNKKIIK